MHPFKIVSFCLFVRFLAFAFVSGAWLVAAGADRSIELTVLRRDQSGKPATEVIRADPARTAVVVIDMWDQHWCKTYTARVGNMVPRMNVALAAARRLGIQVVFAPSDTMEFYKDYPQRSAMLGVAKHTPPPTIPFAASNPPGPTDHCECGPEELCRRGRAWTRQHPGIEIADRDLIGDGNNAQELLNLCQERNIDTLLYMGVASNMCVQYRQFGIRNMKRHGLRAIVTSDLVEAISANGIGPDGKRDRNFTPARGSARVLRHIEHHVAPTFESRQLIAAAGMDAQASDPRPHIVFVIAEREYDTHRTLPAFAKKHLEDDFRCTFCFAKGDDGPGRNDVDGLEALYDADLLVLSMRRRALPVVQMDHLERYIHSGKPLVGIRTSIVPFQVNEQPPVGHVTWYDFDKEVLGCHYKGYDGESRKTGCDVWVDRKATEHPIVRDLLPPTFHSPSWIYIQQPVAEEIQVLLRGRWSRQSPEQSVAWTNTYQGGRVFFTTLGHPGDFELEPFQQLLTRGIHWALGGLRS